MRAAVERAVFICGSQAALARACGVTQAHVWNWLHRDKVLPGERAIQIEKATLGQVRREEIRPDLWSADE
ncbi:MAG: helix-turn-helix domain-containing protein [Acidithiobacillus sp.]